jgi:uncharacterized protein (TIGR02598 family)
LGSPDSPVLITPKWPCGFSLIEVTLSLAIVSFALFPMVALLPVGLQTVHDSMDQTVSASIAQQIRGELQQVSFNSNDSYNINTLLSQVNYYTTEGIKTTLDAADAYYKASFSISGATAASSTFASNNAQAVTVTLAYPTAIPPAAQKKITFTLFTARQRSLD